jgi:two-component system CheB/CheR fusion protein
MSPAKKKKSGAGRKRPGNDASARSTAGRKRPAPASARPATDDELAPARRPGFPIVGVGGSAGALPALRDLLIHMPSDCGLALVVIVHTDPHAPSMLPELLSRHTRMPVLEAASGQRLEASRVYVAPPGRDVRIEKGVLALEPSKDRERGLRLPIDIFFRSLAQDQGPRAVGVVLSGTGADGTLGCGVIRAEGGLVLAQDPSSAEFGGMPGSAIAAGVVDLALATSEMPERLLAHAALLAIPERAQALGGGASELDQILALVHRRTGRDFSLYKRGTLQRRAERRMHLLQVEQLSDYVRLLAANPSEVEALWKDWLIGVSHFFRDPDAFKLLLEAELPRLVKAKPEGAVVRVWVPGCATGEEAYTIAILLVEAVEGLRRSVDIQVFGTDLDARSIDVARTGRYPEGIASDVSEERLTRFFLREERTYRVKKEIRDLIVFAVQDVLRDPPFTRTDLISCRNLLIYLNSLAQKRLIPLLHYSLNPGGVLLLGASESVTGFENLFSVIDKHWKIFLRKEGAGTRPPIEWTHHASFPVPARAEPRTPAAPPKLDLADLLRRSLTERYAPPAVIVDESGQIEHVHGRTGTYLEPAPGRANLNVLQMAREGLRAPLAAALREVLKRDVASVEKSARVRSNGGLTSVELSVRRLRDAKLDRPLLVISFQKPARDAHRASGRKAGKKRGDVEGAGKLEEELRTTRADLQSSIEELQATNEELSSASEEVQSVNEELQSANEELQTSKEETQSLNEELQTLNAELSAKVQDLGQSHDDLVNLINSTDFAMVFLDSLLRVKRFTPEAQRMFRLIESDVGRPLGDLSTSLVYPDLLVDAERALEALAPSEKEVRAIDGSWYSVRIRLYRTSRNAIEGLVILLANVTNVKRAEQAARHAQALAESIVDGVREPLLVLDRELRVVRANHAFCRTFQVRLDQTEGRLVYDLGNRQWDIPKLRELLEQVLPTDDRFDDFEVVHEFPEIGRRRMLLNARRIVQEGDEGPDLILLVFEDASKPLPPGSVEGRP